MSPSVDQQKPRPLVPAHHRLNPLPVEPSRCFHGFRAADRRDVRGERSDMSVDETAKSVRNRGHHPRKSRALGSHYNCRQHRAAQRLARRRIARKSRLRKRFSLHRQQSLCRASHLRRRVACVFRDDADRQLRAHSRRQLLARCYRFQRPLAQRHAAFIRMRQYENGFHHSAPIHSMTSRAISSALMFFSTRVVLCCFGRLTET